MLGECRKQSASRAGLGLDVGQVDDGPVAKVGVVRALAVDDEAMKPIARPRVAGAQRLENDEGLPELGCASGCMLQREAPPWTSGSHHPVKDEAPVRDVFVSQHAYADLGDGFHGVLPLDAWVGDSRFMRGYR